MSQDFIAIGKVLKPLGLHGEVKVALLTDFPCRFDDLQEVIVQLEGMTFSRFQISRVRHGPPFVYLTFHGLTDVSAVECLRGALLQIPQSERVSLPEGSYFHSDLIGMDVYLKGGDILGKVKKILETGSNDILVVMRGQREYLIPAIQRVIKEVHLKQKRLVIEPIEGLLDL